MALWADVLYACDGPWWDVYFDEVRKTFDGELWTQDEIAANKYGLYFIRSESAPGLGKYDVIHTGENSGYQMVNLAYLFGAKKIILLGFDMQRTGGKSHCHGDHPAGLNRSSPLEKFAKNFNSLAADFENEGVEIINATRETALTCFPKIKLEEIL